MTMFHSKEEIMQPEDDRQWQESYRVYQNMKRLLEDWGLVTDPKEVEKDSPYDVF